MVRKVLIVDDSPVARMIAKKCIGMLGECTMFEAGDGQAGFEKFKEVSPDITFMDLTMPVMDGIEALVEIKKVAPAAVVVVATADIQQQTISRAMEAGAYTVLKKPLSPQAVYEVFQKLGLNAVKG
ncbi:MAG: histidine kinase [Deltaproteobacteria bacterium RIFOXYD12_FULL_57_12]|nr:MAG: histidine kinase [Deltaproteobacteria bacterium RIFOXYD12_FULL_57_12]